MLPLLVSVARGRQRSFRTLHNQGGSNKGYFYGSVFDLSAAGARLGKGGICVSRSICGMGMLLAVVNVVSAEIISLLWH